MRPVSAEVGVPLLQPLQEVDELFAFVAQLLVFLRTIVVDARLVEGVLLIEPVALLVELVLAPDIDLAEHELTLAEGK